MATSERVSLESFNPIPRSQSLMTLEDSVRQTLYEAALSSLIRGTAHIIGRDAFAMWPVNDWNARDRARIEEADRKFRLEYNRSFRLQQWIDRGSTIEEATKTVDVFHAYL